LSNAHIQAAVEAGRKRTAEKLEITHERVLGELAKIAFLDVRKAFNPDGSLKPIDELDDNTAAAIAGLEVAAINDDGVTIGTLKKIKLADKISALEKLGRNLGLFNDKLTLKGDAENPLVAFVADLQGTGLRVRR
jgi:phage terminase small subunit